MKQNNQITNCIYFTDVFTPRGCQKVINMQSDLKLAPVYDVHSGGHLNLPPENPYRKTKGQEFPLSDDNLWLYENLWDIFKGVNRDFFHFQLEKMSMVQLLKYEVGDFFNWHMDLGPGQISTRKLSMVVHLSNDQDYDGGELRWNPGFGKVPQSQGTVVIFPSYVPHTVKPVTRGERYTLVAWANGNAFQ